MSHGHHHARRKWGPALSSALLVAAVSAISVVANTNFHADPRFDGAGYAVLGEALATGRGYCEIDHPDELPHAHFPPGYPLALAALWRVTGRSAVAAHTLSVCCTIAATLAAWLWFRAMYRPIVALGLGLALAVNWTWGRMGGEIQSEPLFVLLEQLTVLAAITIGRRGGFGAGLVVGILLGACVLTRHVGITLALAVAIDGVSRAPQMSARAGNPRTVGLGAVGGMTIVLLPWIGWLISVGHNTQAGLLARGSLRERVTDLLLFYLQRIPDQVMGPFVEVGTVFRRSPALAVLATGWAAIATGVIVLGWLRTLRTSRRRLAGLVAFVTLGLLLVWPFTEAGRFLIPLLPFVLVGAVEGLATILHWADVPGRNPLSKRKTIGYRAVAVVIVLAASAPYAVYAIVTGRAEAQRRTHGDFDAACSWIARHATRPGPVLTRHPGEVYWRTGRRAVAPPANNPDAVAAAIRQYEAAYLLIDDERYARAPVNPLNLYLKAYPERARVIWQRASGASRVSVVLIVRS